MSVKRRKARLSAFGVSYLRSFLAPEAEIEVEPSENKKQHFDLYFKGEFIACVHASCFIYTEDKAMQEEKEKEKEEKKPFLVNRYSIDEGIALLEQAMLEVFFQEERELILQEELEENRTLVLKDSTLKSLDRTGVCLWQVKGDREILRSLEDRRSKYIAYKKCLTPLTLTVQQVQILIKASQTKREEIVRVLISYSEKEALPANYSMAGIMEWYETYCL